jgi:hypothetical protein
MLPLNTFKTLAVVELNFAKTSITEKVAPPNSAKEVSNCHPSNTGACPDAAPTDAAASASATR